MALSDRDRRALLTAYRSKGDTAARDELIADLLPFARSLARRHADRGEELDDLVQIAAVGLVKAIERFDLERETSVIAYVSPTIVGEIKRHFRDHAWAVVVPRRLKELGASLARASDGLTKHLGRSPTIGELAAAVGAGEEETLEALEVANAYRSRSLFEAATSSEGGAFELIDLVGSEEAGYETSENWALLSPGMSALEERERRILYLRFFEGLPQSQIAARLGISQMHVSRLIRQAMETLATEIESRREPRGRNAA